MDSSWSEMLPCGIVFFPFYPRMWFRPPLLFLSRFVDGFILIWVLLLFPFYPKMKFLFAKMSWQHFHGPDRWFTMFIWFQFANFFSLSVWRLDRFTHVQVLLLRFGFGLREIPTLVVTMAIIGVGGFSGCPCCWWIFLYFIILPRMLM